MVILNWEIKLNVYDKTILREVTMNNLLSVNLQMDIRGYMLIPPLYLDNKIIWFHHVKKKIQRTSEILIRLLEGTISHKPTRLVSNWSSTFPHTL